MIDVIMLQYDGGIHHFICLVICDINFREGRKEMFYFIYGYMASLNFRDGVMLNII